MIRPCGWESGFRHCHPNKVRFDSNCIIGQKLLFESRFQLKSTDIFYVIEIGRLKSILIKNNPALWIKSWTIFNNGQFS